MLARFSSMASAATGDSHPDDANTAGNCHGGVILRLIEEAGQIAATRFAKTPTAIARIEKMEFEKPMHIGDLAQLEAKVTFSSGKNTMGVDITVIGETLAKGIKRVTNHAQAWYVGVKEGDCIVKFDNTATTFGPRLMLAEKIPKFLFPSREHEIAMHAQYEKNKELRRGSLISRFRMPTPVISHLVLPSDCNAENNIAMGGAIMKLMDSSAGVVAWRHCATNVVTASIDALSFEAPILLGNLVCVYARPTYASKKSLEIEVHVEAEDLFTSKRWNAVSAHFTFVSLDKNNHPIPMKPLPEPHTQDEQIDRVHGEERYKVRQANRIHKE